ncbi:cupin domain-containing protein [Neobacillus niacini]|uniref:cupin domain-containing protein n=1 Tax=Neobacillus niacini TaxID=86668 RepID=UPI0021CB62BE|nr:cupin domain-containing protein [Neobacillus niacini]MCM3764495.1 cupin domain-containing protein [Neobacillus niacini]
MITANLNSLQFLEGWFENDPATRQRTAFPLYKSTGTTSLSVVYFEIEPGNNLGTHSDSAEEIILVLEGKAEATVNDEIGQLTKGEMAVIPKMVPHNIRNIGSETLKVVGFFSSPYVASTFVEPLMPINQNVVGTPPIESENPMSWNEIFCKITGQ